MMIIIIQTKNNIIPLIVTSIIIIIIIIISISIMMMIGKRQSTTMKVGEWQRQWDSGDGEYDRINCHSDEQLYNGCGFGSATDWRWRMARQWSWLMVDSRLTAISMQQSLLLVSCRLMGAVFIFFNRGQNWNYQFCRRVKSSL